MSKKGNKENDKILVLCMKYYVCTLCPRNKKCDKELKEERRKAK